MLVNQFPYANFVFEIISLTLKFLIKFSDIYD